MLRKLAAVKVTTCGLAKCLKGSIPGVLCIGEEGVDVQGARVKSLEYPGGEVLLCGTLLASKWAFVCYLFTSFCLYVRVFMLLGAPGLLLAMSLVLDRGDFVPVGFCACALVSALDGCV